MAGREPDGSENCEHPIRPSFDAPLANSNQLMSLSYSRDSTGCSECAAAKANAYKAGLALVAHMDELQKVQKKLKEKEDLLKVYSARDKYIDEIVTKNEQLSDDLSRIHTANAELKEKIKRQDQRILDLLRYEKTYQEAIGLKKSNVKLKEYLEKSEEQRRAVNRKYKDSVLFAKERVEHLVNEVKEANAEIVRWKNQKSEVSLVQEFRQLISDLVEILAKNGLYSDDIRKRCDPFVGVNYNVAKNDHSKRIRIISNRSLSTTSDDDDARELESLMQHEEVGLEETKSTKTQHSTHELNMASTSDAHVDKKKIKSILGPQQELAKPTLDNETDDRKCINISSFARKNGGSKKVKQLKSKIHTMDTTEDAHSKFLTRKISQGVSETLSSTDNVSSALNGKKTKTIKEQQFETIVMRKEQKIVETSIKNNSNFEDERAYQLISDGRVNKGREEGKPSSNFLDDFVLSDSDDESEGAANGTEPVTGITENEASETNVEMATSDILKTAVIKKVIIDDEKKSDILCGNLSNLEVSAAAVAIKHHETNPRLKRSYEQDKGHQKQPSIKNSPISNTVAPSFASEIIVSKKSRSIRSSAVKLLKNNDDVSDSAIVSVNKECNMTGEESLGFGTISQEGGTTEEKTLLQNVISPNNVSFIEKKQEVADKLLFEDGSFNKERSIDGMVVKKDKSDPNLARSIVSSSKSAEIERNDVLFTRTDVNMKQKAIFENESGGIGEEYALINSDARIKRGVEKATNVFSNARRNDITNDDEEMATAALVIERVLDSLSIVEETGDIRTVNSLSHGPPTEKIRKSSHVSDVIPSAENENKVEKEKGEDQCFCYRALLLQCEEFLLGCDEVLDPYIPIPRRRKSRSGVKSQSIVIPSNDSEVTNGTEALTTSKGSGSSESSFDYRKKLLPEVSHRTMSDSVESDLVSSSVKPLLIEEKSQLPDILSTKSPAGEELLLAEVIASDPLLIEKESLSSESSSSLLIEEEPLSPEVSLPNSDFCLSNGKFREYMSDSGSKLIKQSSLLEKQEIERTVDRPKTHSESTTSIKSSDFGSDKRKSFVGKLNKNKAVKRLRDTCENVDEVTAKKSPINSRTVDNSSNGKNMVMRKLSVEGSVDKLDGTLKSKQLRDVEGLGKTINRNEVHRNGNVSEKRRDVAKCTGNEVQRLKRVHDLGKSVQKTTATVLPLKKSKVVNKVQSRYETKNCGTAVLSLLDDFLVKKCRLEDILIKFRELAVSQSLSANELSLHLVKYVNNANTGKVPWSSLIGLIQRGKSLPGNLVELINQLSAECQWTTLGIEFYRKLCLSFVRSNQVLNASRHLNIGCCLILTARALSMDHELIEETDRDEIRVLLLGILKYSVCNHPSEWVVPILCLAQKFVPHLVKELFCTSGFSNNATCELISVHLAAKRDYLLKFLSLWRETEVEDPVDIRAIDAATFKNMLHKREDDVLNVKNGVDIEKQIVSPHMQFIITSYVSLFLVADQLLFPDKLNYTLNLLSHTLAALTGSEETLYAVNVNNTRDKNINALLLCAYILRGIRGMYRLNADSTVCLKKLAFDAYELYRNVHLKLQEQAVSIEDQRLRFVIEQLLFALQI